ncbi:hypothetical protein FU659_09790 [Paenibacillus sp. N3.4]|nr:hypothetical protein FU659_09790 [Paenibacillus sp. N3.4]
MDYATDHFYPLQYLYFGTGGLSALRGESMLVDALYWTPDFVMGCVQRQDDYPDIPSVSWYAHHEQHQWDITFGSKTQTNASSRK